MDAATLALSVTLSRVACAPSPPGLDVVRPAAADTGGVVCCAGPTAGADEPRVSENPGDRLSISTAVAAVRRIAAAMLPRTA